MSVRKVGIIGAGTMGSGIAQKIAQEGIEVALVDTEDRFVQKGMDNIRKSLADAVGRRILTPEQATEAANRIKPTTNLEAVKDADIIIEVIFEDMNVKRELFTKLDVLCDKKTVLASNTSSFSIDELASSVKRRDRFLGLHFFYHPAKNRLLEVIPGRDTSKETVALGNSFSKLIGKTAIGVKDAPGFAVNRFFVPWLNEATRLMGEGVANAPTIDEVAKKVFGIGMGPFELMNVTGIPIAYHSTVSLGKSLGAFYAPSDALRKQFESKETWDLKGNVDSVKAAEIEDRLLGTVFVVACQLVEDGVASIEDTDRGAKIGLRWTLGPFEMMNRYGIDRSYSIATGFVLKHPDLKMPDNLRQRHEHKEGWYFSYVDLFVEGSIARIVFNRPEAMNAINEEVVRQLDDQFKRAESDPGVKAIVLEGAGKAFVAGADIQYFIDKIKNNKIDDIVNFTRYGHSVLERIDASKKLVIAKLDGLALGGGAEICLTADTIVASEKGTIGFPETGIGIYPGLGGTQRTSRCIGKELAKYLVLTGKILDAKGAASIGLVEYVVPREEIDGRILALASSKEVITKSTKKGLELTEELKQIQRYFSDENIQATLSGAESLDATGKKIAKTISYKAPLAIKLSNRIIDEGSKLALGDGLRLELDHLKEIFSTKDAYEGLSSVVARRRPVFKGE